MSQSLLMGLAWVCAPLQSCLTLCGLKDHGQPGSSVHGVFPAAPPEWVAIRSPRESSRFRTNPSLMRLHCRRILTAEPVGETQCTFGPLYNVVVSILMCLWCRYVYISIGYTQKWNWLERRWQLPQKDDGELSQLGKGSTHRLVGVKRIRDIWGTLGNPRAEYAVPVKSNWRNLPPLDTPSSLSSSPLSMSLFFFSAF